MKIRNGRDFWAGVMFIAFGLGFMLASRNYTMGSAVRMGPAYFPAVLGGLLAVLGGIILLRALVSKIEHPLRAFPFRPLPLVAALIIGTALYFAGERLQAAPNAQFLLAGLTLALFIGAFGSRGLFLILISVAVFGYALQALGLVLATVLLVVISAMADPAFRRQEVVILTIVLVLFSVLVFVKGLGLPFPIWPGA